MGSLTPLLVPRRAPRGWDTAPTHRIPAFRLVAEPLGPEAADLPGFAWAGSAGSDLGRRHQLGGLPRGLAAGEHPRCTSCGRTMTFYAQLDSLNDELVLADAGLLYVFVCLACHTTTSFIHSP
jgi:hypothetical protein